MKEQETGDEDHAFSWSLGHFRVGARRWTFASVAIKTKASCSLNEFFTNSVAGEVSQPPGRVGNLLV